MSKKVSEIEEKKKGYLARRVEAFDRERVDAKPSVSDPTATESVEPAESGNTVDTLTSPTLVWLQPTGGGSEVTPSHECVSGSNAHRIKGHGQKYLKKNKGRCLSVPSRLGLRRQVLPLMFVHEIRRIQTSVTVRRQMGDRSRNLGARISQELRRAGFLPPLPRPRSREAAVLG